jgi:tetratricopeptide (TPR) repeat protein
VQQLRAAADQARAVGDLSSAVAGYRDAEQLLAVMVEEQPHKPDHRAELTLVQRTLGDLLLDMEEFEQALAALDAAEAAGADAGMGPAFLSELRIRRAWAHIQLDHRASGMVDSQLGVAAYLPLLESPNGQAHVLDAARGLALHAFNMLAVGDPDVASAAVDEALFMYMVHADEINADPAKIAVHGRMFRLAAELSEAIHRAYGRAEMAQAAGDAAASARAMVVSDGGDDPAVAITPLRLPSEAEITARWTLAEALEAAGATELRGQLTRPAVDREIVTALDRTEPQLAPAMAVRLTEQVKLLAKSNQIAAIRVALEAHALFAMASQARDTSMRFRLDEFGVPWARMLLQCSRMAAAAGLEACALDFARWIASVVSQLVPHAHIDGVVRATVLECLEWHAGLLSANGDDTQAEEARALADQLETS